MSYSSPPLNEAQSGPTRLLATGMRDQIAGSGLQPSNGIGDNGLSPSANNAELNLAQYPAVSVSLGNLRNAGDVEYMSTESGRQRCADAVVRGIVVFLMTQPPRRGG